MSDSIAPPPAPRISRAIVKFRRDQRVRRLAHRISQECAWLKAADGPLLIAWSQLEILSREAYEQLRSEGLMRPDGTAHPLLQELTRLRRAQAGLGSQLGLGPRAR